MVRERVLEVQGDVPCDQVDARLSAALYHVTRPDMLVMWKEGQVRVVRRIVISEDQPVIPVTKMKAVRSPIQESAPGLCNQIET